MQELKDKFADRICEDCDCRRFGWDYQEQVELFTYGAIDMDPRLEENSRCYKQIKE